MRDRSRTHGLWAKSAPPAPATLPLAGEAQAEILIVGGGYTGLAAALTLAEGGMKAILLEAEEIGHGGAGRNVGLVNAGLWVTPETVEAALGPERGGALLDWLGAGPGLVFEKIRHYGIACEAQRNGTLHCAVGRKGWAELQERERQWQAREAPVELLDRAAAADLIGSTTYEGALLDKRAGTIQPLAYARGLAKAAIAAGAEIHTESPVLSATHDGEDWVVRTPQGVARAPRLILATDAYARHVWPEMREQQIHLPYFNLATAPLSADLLAEILPQRQGCWDTREVLSSFRLDAQGRMIFGSIGALEGFGLKIHRSWGRRAMAKVFPALAETPFEEAWFGWIGMTEDSMPRLHNLGPQALAVGGYNGRGISPGTVFGTALGRHMLGDLALEAIPLPQSGFEIPSWRGAKERSYRLGAEMLHLVDKRL